jgi:hypothetical protein
MAKAFKKLVAKMSPQAQKQIRERADATDLEIRVHVPGHDEVRITQFEHLAKLVELSGEGKKRAAG